MKDSNNFPKKEHLKNAVIEALKNIGGVVTTADINSEVIRILNLSDEIINMEHPDGLCTLLDYRLRWVRTELKKKGIIVNVDRGSWKMND